MNKKILVLAVSLGFLCGVVPAQNAGQLKQEETKNYYEKWLKEDVKYLITPDEETVFKGLTTDEERDQFIEQFWRRRDPDANTLENEFKEEHYRRIAYANEHFHSGRAGWLTDRGMIYIKFGPPNGIEKHPEGGMYVRKMNEGGGFTSTYPFEVWFYQYVDGVGDGVELEFVDASKTNEYRLAMHPDEKDALIHVPNAGLTDDEFFGNQTRSDRIRKRFLTIKDDLFTYKTIRDFPLEKLQQLYKVENQPVVKFKDLEKIVEVRVSYEQLPVDLQIDYLRISNDMGLVPVTLFVENKFLTYEEITEGVKRASLEIYGRVESIQGRLEYAFEDTVNHDQAGRAGPVGVTTYQKRFPLRPGRYKLSLVVREPKSGKMKTMTELIVVEKPDANTLAASSVILTPRVREIEDPDRLADPFVLTNYEVRPVERTEFVPEDLFVQSYFEVYNLAIDQATLQPSAKVEISLLRGTGGEAERVFPFTPIEDEFEYSGDRLVVHKTIPFQGLAPGRYTVQYRISDLTSQQSVERSFDFRIREAGE